MTPPQRCVRCNLGPAYPGHFLCPDCEIDGSWREEAEAARKLDPAHPRLVLKQRGWYGGWPAIRSA